MSEMVELGDGVFTFGWVEDGEGGVVPTSVGGPIYKHQKYAVGFEVSTEHLKDAAAKVGLTLEEYLVKLARNGFEIESVPK